VGNIWNAINSSLNTNKPNAMIEISRCIDKSNGLLREHYQDIQQRLNNFNEIHANRKDIEEQIGKFLQ
jgi:hypothetical protein